MPSLATLSSRCTGSSSHAGSGSRACNALVVVSCTAKGAEMYEGEEGVEARQLLQIGKVRMQAAHLTASSNGHRCRVRWRHAIS